MLDLPSPIPGATVLVKKYKVYVFPLQSKGDLEALVGILHVWMVINFSRRSSSPFTVVFEGV